MSDHTWQIREFDRMKASDAEFAALVDLGNSVLKEAMPDDSAGHGGILEERPSEYSTDC